MTSLNWASAAADRDFPWADIGIHINTPGIAVATMARLRRLFLELMTAATDGTFAANGT